MRTHSIQIANTPSHFTPPTLPVQCIGEAFGVDPADEAQRERLSVKPATLPTIFDVFLKTRAKMDAPAPAAASSSSAPKEPTDEDKTAAEALKAKGNSHMSGKRYDEAIQAYTQAIDLDTTNPVYYSNRAAAHSSSNNHTDAILDAEKAIEVDPSFVKAYHRLGSVTLRDLSMCFFITFS